MNVTLVCVQINPVTCIDNYMRLIIMTTQLGYHKVDTRLVLPIPIYT